MEPIVVLKLELIWDMFFTNIGRDIFLSMLKTRKINHSFNLMSKNTLSIILKQPTNKSLHMFSKDTNNLDLETILVKLM